MITSNKHCETCAFGNVEPAGTGLVATFEADMVTANLIDPRTVRGESAKQIESHARGFEGVTAARCMAARACAQAIKNGDCQDYVLRQSDGDLAALIDRSLISGE